MAVGAVLGFASVVAMMYCRISTLPKVGYLQLRDRSRDLEIGGAKLHTRLQYGNHFWKAERPHLGEIHEVVLCLLASLPNSLTSF